MTISSFKSYLVEEEKTIFFTFGRMNPPTIGHEKLLDKLSRSAGKNPYRVFLSQSNDPAKNPLQYKDKVKLARKMFPRHARSIMIDTSVKNVFDVASKLYDEGYKNVAMVVGSDRLREFDILLNKYNGKKGKHGFYNFAKINVISAGERDPDADGAEGMSASKMRAAAKSGDFAQFAQGLTKSIGNADAKKIFNQVRSAMGLKEETEFRNHVKLSPVSEEREAYVSGDLYQIGDSVVIKESGEVGTVKHLGTNYIIVETKSGDYRKWLDAVELLEREDPDIGHKKGKQPAQYYKGVAKSTKDDRAAHFKKHGKKDDDDPSAYKPAPGDATAKTKPSKHTKKFKDMFGEKMNVDMAKKRIERQKAAMDKRHDRMMDRARMRDVKKKNRETT